MTWSAWPFHFKEQRVNEESNERILLSEKAQATQNQAKTTPPRDPTRTRAVTAATQGRPPEDVILNVSTRYTLQQTPRIIH